MTLYTGERIINDPNRLVFMVSIPQGNDVEMLSRRNSQDPCTNTEHFAKKIHGTETCCDARHAVSVASEFEHC